MAGLDVSKTMEKIRRKEIWNAKKAVCDDLFSVAKLFISPLQEKACSTSMKPTSNENDVVSDESTMDGDSESGDEIISGSAQNHLVFNLAELARVLEDADDGFASFPLPFPLLFGFNVNYLGSQMQKIQPPGPRQDKGLLIF